MKQLSQTDSLQEQRAWSDTIGQVAQDTPVTITGTCQVPVKAGIEGEPLPYKLESDEAVVGAIGVCFILLLLALQKGSKSVIPFLKEALMLRSSSNTFDERISISSVTTAALCASTMLSSGICLYRYYSSSFPSGEEIGHSLIIIAYSFAFAILIIGKSFLYQFVNWIFFSNEKKRRWEQGYWGLIAASGVVLFPTLLYAVFLDSEVQISDYLLLMILGIFKILLFYKLFGNFFTHFYGILHLIVYFCALEIIPDLFVWKGVEIFNNLILKF